MLPQHNLCFHLVYFELLQLTYILPVVFNFLHLPLCEICQDKDFLWLVFSRVGRESTILTLCGKIRVRKYPYSGTFYTAYIILRTYTLFYKHEVNLGQLQICLRYLRFEPQSMLKIYLCVDNISFCLL